MKNVWFLVLMMTGLNAGAATANQLTMKVQIIHKMAWGGEGYHFTAVVQETSDSAFSLKEFTFDTHSSSIFHELEAVAGKETYLWEYGDPSKVSNNYTTDDVYTFEFICGSATELMSLPEEKLRYERGYIHEPVRGFYWWIKSVRALV